MKSVNDIYVLGDIHGKISIIEELIIKNDLKNCYILCVGDFGIGSFLPDIGENGFIKLNNLLKSKNIIFYTIRGNHDNPKYFDGSYTYSNLKLLKDYHFEIINDIRFLFVGGAISIDRILRMKKDLFMMNPNLKCWWADEKFIYDETKIKECDILITHSCSSWQVSQLLLNNNILDNISIIDYTLINDLKDEQNDIGKLMINCKCKQSYHGHFHMSNFIDRHDIRSMILDINELHKIS